MTYLSIGDIDLSQYCNKLTVKTNKKYNAQTNAAGDTVVDYIKSKHTLEVGFIHMDITNQTMLFLKDLAKGDSLFVKYQNPLTNQLEEIICFVAESTLDYYTIRNDKIQIKPFTVSLVEL